MYYASAIGKFIELAIPRGLAAGIGARRAEQVYSVQVLCHGKMREDLLGIRDFWK